MALVINKSDEDIHGMIDTSGYFFYLSIIFHASNDFLHQ